MFSFEVHTWTSHITFYVAHVLYRGKMQIQNLLDTAVKGSLIGGIVTMIGLNLAVGPILQALHCDALMVTVVSPVHVA